MSILVIYIVLVFSESVMCLSVVRVLFYLLGEGKPVALWCSDCVQILCVF